MMTLAGLNEFFNGYVTIVGINPLKCGIFNKKGVVQENYFKIEK